jgi:hypothetical protein
MAAFRRHHCSSMIVSIAAAYSGMALRDKTEQTISPAKTLDEGVIEFPVAGSIESPYKPRVKRIVSRSVRHVSDTRKHPPVYIYAWCLHSQMIKSANL